MTTDTRPGGRVLQIMRRASLTGITALVAAMGVVSFAESFRGLYLWAGGHGLAGIWQLAWPLMLDSFIAVGEFALVVALTDRWPFRWRIGAWVVTLAGLAASVAGNVGHAAGHDWATRVTAAVPPLAAAATLAVGLGVLKRVAGQAPALALPEPVTEHSNAQTLKPPNTQTVLDPAALALAPSDAARVRLAAATLRTTETAPVAAALAAAGHPVATEAARSALRRIRDDQSAEPLALASSGV